MHTVVIRLHSVLLLNNMTAKFIYGCFRSNIHNIHIVFPFHY
jgi:hypothetical protein